MKPYETDGKHLVEYDDGLLLITDRETLETWVVGLRNDKGQSIVSGQYRDACRTHGADRAIATFKRLAIDESPIRLYKRLPNQGESV